MSNKVFEDKVLNALGQLSTDVTKLGTRVGGLEKQVTKLDTRVEGLENQVAKLDDKVDTQTVELKNEMRQNTAYLNQAFINISRIDQERFMEKNHVKYT